MSVSGARCTSSIIFLIFLPTHLSAASDWYSNKEGTYVYHRTPLRAATIDVPRIYHYDNLTHCQAVCEVQCETTQVVNNDQEQRLQHTCRRRKPPPISALSSLYQNGSMKYLVAVGLIGVLIIFFLSCCWFSCYGISGCNRKDSHLKHSSNDPLVNGEFREILDAKDIGYLKNELSRRAIVV
ncbi:hypothetical protein AB6A40_004597 [Gnathostoma spinigerum]|uniref:Uncharacterized protein n=1 Tax=Gnathostoma spinigerum TaxID=75299 RepID=A0ABD6ECY9_9BILA